jgi:hypothetical protein
MEDRVISHRCRQFQAVGIGADDLQHLEGPQELSVKFLLEPGSFDVSGIQPD